MMNLVVTTSWLEKEVTETLAVKMPQSNPNNTGLTLKYPIGRGRAVRLLLGSGGFVGIAGGGLQSDGAQT